jgi:uncharacterized protein (TIGR00255 family)
MTGFGQASEFLGELDIAVELRTVNSRYFDFRPRLGKELSSLEGRLKKEIQRRITRGRVDLYVEVTPKASDQLELNEALVKNYLALAGRVRAAGVSGELSLQDLLSLPGVCVPKREELTAEGVGEGIVQIVREAVDMVAQARKSEGHALRNELQKRLSRVERQVEQIAKQTDEVNEYYKKKLELRLEEVLGDYEVDEVRLAQEVFYYAEKSDITEEITRLQSHFDQFTGYLQGSEEGPVGKTLDFLCQEMNREINTILSKSALGEISGIAIDAKGEIEKIREQVQNVE